MANCRLSTIPAAIREVHGLRAVSINHNLITAVYRGDFVGMTSLLAVLLGQNPVAAVEPGVFAALSNLSVTSAVFDSYAVTTLGTAIEQPSNPAIAP
jgi:hypothetical protein